MSAAITEFNARYPVGTSVRFWSGLREGEGQLGTTWTDAQMLSGNTAVVYVRDFNGNNRGSMSLTHVQPLESEGGARWA
ncbi:MAG TPA: hypothetical protein VN622_11110 [Clostridia bacterium]|nr:hypothetical protein [Clostridia bacterium]